MALNNIVRAERFSIWNRVRAAGGRRARHPRQCLATVVAAQSNALHSAIVAAFDDERCATRRGAAREPRYSLVGDAARVAE